MTIEKLLHHVEPWQIFVADNGSSPAQVQETEFACDIVSERYRLDHPDYVDEGNINFGRYAAGAYPPKRGRGRGDEVCVCMRP